jgi:hypothetical protein
MSYAEYVFDGLSDKVTDRLSQAQGGEPLQ